MITPVSEPTEEQRERERLAALPAAAAFVQQAFDESVRFVSDHPPSPEVLAAVVDLGRSLNEWLNAHIERVADTAVAAGEIDPYGSLVSWSAGGDTVDIRGETSGCGRGCCPPESRYASFPTQWLRLPGPTLKALLGERKAAREAKAAAESARQAQAEQERARASRQATYERLRAEFDPAGSAA